MPARLATSPHLVILWSTHLIKTAVGSSRRRSSPSASSSTSILTLRSRGSTASKTLCQKRISGTLNAVWPRPGFVSLGSPLHSEAHLNPDADQREPCLRAKVSVELKVNSDPIEGQSKNVKESNEPLVVTPRQVEFVPQI